MDETELIWLVLFDWLMALMIVWLAWRALFDPDPFRAIVTFIAFGLFIALAWVRLRAPDVALAEAAIGSGLTGALLLSALARMRRRELERGDDASRRSP